MSYEISTCHTVCGQPLEATFSLSGKHADTVITWGNVKDRIEIERSTGDCWMKFDQTLKGAAARAYEEKQLREYAENAVFEYVKYLVENV